MSSKIASTIRLREAEHRAVEVDVVAPGELGLEPRAELEQRGERAAKTDLAGRRLQDAADALEQRRLARAVVADDAHGLALADGEVDVVERGEEFGRARARVQQALLQRLVSLVVDLEVLGDVLDLDDGDHYSSDSKLPSRRPKIASAKRKRERRHHEQVARQDRGTIEGPGGQDVEDRAGDGRVSTTVDDVEDALEREHDRG